MLKEHEDRICLILKALVEEWKPENVIVSLPKAWKSDDIISKQSPLGLVKLECVTDNTVEVRVQIKDRVYIKQVVPAV